MHREIIKHATIEQLKDFVECAIDEIKYKDKELYDELEMKLYREVYGSHFNEWILDSALSELVNEDGTTGGHWTLEQTTSVAKNNGIAFDKFNEYDWCYTMNMIYSDYYGAVSNDLSVYVRLAKKFLDDKDADKGKAFRYYIMMKYVD